MAEAGSRNLRRGTRRRCGGDLENPGYARSQSWSGSPASVAIGVAVVLWSQLNYPCTVRQSRGKDAKSRSSALQQTGVTYRVGKGQRHADGADVQAQGTPHAAGGPGPAEQCRNGLRADAAGYRFRHQPDGREARYQQACRANWHAPSPPSVRCRAPACIWRFPKQSVFVRKRQPPSASVALRLHTGRILEDGQVEAIVHMVASSIPNSNRAA